MMEEIQCKGILVKQENQMTNNIGIGLPWINQKAYRVLQKMVSLMVCSLFILID